MKKITDKVAIIYDCNQKLLAKKTVYRNTEDDQSYVCINGRFQPLGMLAMHGCRIQISRVWDKEPAAIPARA